jgi:hypothetical protein
MRTLAAALWLVLSDRQTPLAALPPLTRRRRAAPH